jgi:four helix bundle protein
MDLAVIGHGIARRISRTRASALASQIQRAAGSVPANIAEGAGRRSRADFLRHLSIANGSLLELETHLLLADRVGLASEDHVASALVLSAEIGRMLAGLMNHLRSSNSDDPRSRS